MTRAFHSLELLVLPYQNSSSGRTICPTSTSAMPGTTAEECSVPYSRGRIASACCAISRQSASGTIFQMARQRTRALRCLSCVYSPTRLPSAGVPDSIGYTPISPRLMTEFEDWRIDRQVSICRSIHCEYCSPHLSRRSTWRVELISSRLACLLGTFLA